MKTTNTLLGFLAIGFALWFGATVQAQTDDAQSLANSQVEAEKGNAKAQYDFGIILEQKNQYAEALQWFCMAAEQNYSAAQLKIGVFFVSGEVVAKDKLKAYEWYLLASSQGNSTAREYANYIEDNSILLPEQLLKGKEEFQSFTKNYLAEQKEVRDKPKAEAQAKIDAQIKADADAEAKLKADAEAQAKIDAADAAAKLEAQMKATAEFRRNAGIAAGVLAAIAMLCFTYRKKLHQIYGNQQKAAAEQRLANFKKEVSAYDDQALLDILKYEEEKYTPDMLTLAGQEAEKRGGIKAMAERVKKEQLAIAESIALEQLKDQVHRLSDEELLEALNYHPSTSSPDPFSKIDPYLTGLSHKEPSERLALVEGILKAEADARGGIEALRKVKVPPASESADVQTAFSTICPFCKEEIKEGAIKCKHCGEILSKDSYVETKASPVNTAIRIEKPIGNKTNQAGLGGIGFNYKGSGEIIILASFLIAIISLFMPWIEMGVISASGWSCRGYVFLLPFVYPVIGVFNAKVFNKIAGVICGLIALIVSIWYIADKHYNDDFFGKGNASAIGLYLFAATTIGLIIGAIKYKRNS